MRPRQIEEWLAGLPKGNAHDSGRKLQQVLYNQNRSALDPATRVNLMELYQDTVIATVASLQQQYTTTSYPLSQRATETYELVQRLITEMANGYKVTANDLAASLGEADQRDALALAIQRSVHYLSAALLNAYEVYVACPVGVWRDLHQLYQFVEATDLLALSVAVPASIDAQNTDTTIAAAYRRILLVGACNPYGLLQAECRRLYQLIPILRSETVVTRELEYADPTGRFLIGLGWDAPPVPVVKAPRRKNEEHLRLLVVLDVVREVHSLLKNLERGSTLRALHTALPGAEPAHGDLLRRVGRVLGGINVRRRSNRTAKEAAVALCTGVNAIHYFASGQRRFQPPVDAGEPTEGVPAPTPGLALAVNDDLDTAEEVYIDLADPVLAANGLIQDIGAPEGAARPPDDQWGRGVTYRLHECLTVDESATGLRLKIYTPSDLRMRVGDPIALCYPTPDRWRAGVVRWMRSSSAESLEAGVQFLAPELVPVAVRRHVEVDQPDAPFFQGLLLPGNAALKQPESLLVPRGTCQPSDTLVIWKSGTSDVIVPLRILDRTGSYDQLLLGPSPNG